MGQGRVGTLRILLAWSAVDPTSAGDDLDFSSVDPIVLAAAEQGIQVMPVLFGTPEWAAVELDGRASCEGDCGPFAPRSDAALAAWGDFVGAAVDRYGPEGELWAQNPDVRRADPHLADLERAELADLLSARASIRATSTCSRPPSRRSTSGIRRPRSSSAECSAPRPSRRGSRHGMGIPARAVRDRGGGRPVRRRRRPPLRGEGRQGRVAGRAPARRDRAGRRLGGRAVDHRARLGVGRSAPTRSTAVPRVRPSGSPRRSTCCSRNRTEWNIEGVNWYSWRDASGPGLCDWCGGSGLFAEEALEPKPAWDAFTGFTGGS